MTSPIVREISRDEYRAIRREIADATRSLAPVRPYSDPLAIAYPSRKAPIAKSLRAEAIFVHIA